jgi:hypothetical protein
MYSMPRTISLQGQGSMQMPRHKEIHCIHFRRLPAGLSKETVCVMHVAGPDSLQSCCHLYKALCHEKGHAYVSPSQSLWQGGGRKLQEIQDKLKQRATHDWHNYAIYQAVVDYKAFQEYELFVLAAAQCTNFLRAGRQVAQEGAISPLFPSATHPKESQQRKQYCS